MECPVCRKDMSNDFFIIMRYPGASEDFAVKKMDDMTYFMQHNKFDRYMCVPCARKEAETFKGVQP